MTPATLWPAAVSERSAHLLAAARRPAVVLGAFPTALYLKLEGHADVLPVVSATGLRLPTALALGVAVPTVGWGVQPGTEVVVGADEVGLPGVTIRAVRRWRPVPVPRASLHAGGTLAGLDLSGLAGRRPARQLTEALLRREPVRAHVAALVGAGPGLTPSGDDVLCGVLLGLRVAGPVGAGLVTALWAAVEPRLTSTTSLSAALLTEAAHGYAAAPVVRLVEALVAGWGTGGAGPQGGRGSGRTAVVAAADDVLAIGHSSGADLLGGLAGCLDAVAGQQPWDLGRRSLP